jgi:hypothetical protein
MRGNRPMRIIPAALPVGCLAREDPVGLKGAPGVDKVEAFAALACLDYVVMNHTSYAITLSHDAHSAAKCSGVPS